MKAAWPDDVETLSFVLRLKPGTQAEHRRRRDRTVDRIPDHPVGRRWRAYMPDVLETVEGTVPRVDPLTRMFSLSAGS